MLEWMIMPFKRIFDFTGRSRRKEFWFFMLLNVIVMIALFAVVLATGGMGAALADADPANPLAIYGALFSGAGVIIALYWLAVIIPSISVSVRRLHDRDMSGWWYLGFIVLSIIPIVGLLASIAYLVLMCLEGTKGPNRFGPDPKNPTDAAVFT